MKKDFIISIILIVAVAAACLSGCDAKLASEAVAEDKVHISFSFWEPSVDNNLEKGLEAVITNYKKIHPEVEIELISKPVSGYQEWMKEQFAANNAPTIESNHTSSIVDQYNQGLVYDFKEELDKVNEYDGVIWREKFSEKKLQQAHNGISLPWFDLGVAYYYNKNIYSELGLNVPETWNEFMANCEAIKNSGKNPIALMAQKRDAVTWLRWYIETGLVNELVFRDKKIDADGNKNITTEEMKEAVRNGTFDVTKGEYRKALEMLLNEYVRYSGYAEKAIELDETEAKQEFLTGNAAHIMSGSWDMKSFTDNKAEGVEIGAFSLPVFTEENTEWVGDIPFIGGVQSIAITNSADEEQKAAAMNFLKFLFSEEQYKLFYETTLQMPTMKGFDIEEKYEPFQASGWGAHTYYMLDEAENETIVDIMSGVDIDIDEMIKKIQEENYEAVIRNKK